MDEEILNKLINYYDEPQNEIDTENDSSSQSSYYSANVEQDDEEKDEDNSSLDLLNQDDFHSIFDMSLQNELQSIRQKRQSSFSGFGGEQNQIETSNFAQMIAGKESAGKANPYMARAVDKNGNEVSSATGKYQFLWNTHGKDIQRVTGVKSREDFMNSPDAQESYFNFWSKNVLTPQAQKYIGQVRQYIPGISIEKLKKALHFAGPGNIEKAIKTGNFDKPLDAFNTTINQYIQ